MELQFHKTALPGLQLVKREVQNLEETQELRIPDALPDIGRVLGSWGQVLLRSKEWRSGSAHVSGGVQAWTLYMPEDSSDVQCIQTWIPFHAKWDLPDTDLDGVINTQCLLRSIDARTTASRKVMLRANVGVMGEMWIPAESNLYVPENMPEDICLLRRKYAVLLPREMGEKAFTIEEKMSLQSAAPIDKILYYRLEPEVQEKKILSDKVVFRGAARLHTLYQGKDGQLHNWDTELPFSQYSELEREYSPGASVRILPAVTGMEMEPDPEGGVSLRAEMTGQYMICEQTDLDAVEDAYSPQRAVQTRMERMQLPIISEEQRQSLTAEQTVPHRGRTVDVSFMQDHPYRMPGSDAVSLGIPGQFQLLSRDEDGILQYAAAKWEGQWELPADEHTVFITTVQPADKPQTAFDGSGTLLSTNAQVDVLPVSMLGISMVSGLEVGELMPPDPGRPSLILRRAGEDSLWELAKKTGSTVERIRSANHLEQEPTPEQMLLIPVL